MKNPYPSEQGGFVKKLMLIVVMVCTIFIVFAAVATYIGPNTIGGLSSIAPGTSLIPASQPSGKNNPLIGFLDSGSGYGSYGGSGASYTGSSDIPASARSPYAGVVSLGNGSASYSYQPIEEYVTLRNNGASSVDITGWTLTNGKGTRPIQTIENNYVYPTADSAAIGQGTEFLDPSGRFQVSDIILAPGDSAIVTTGGPFAQFPFSITTSFRENICDGYLKNYPFAPSIELECPSPSQDPLINTVTSECYDYMQSLNRCEDPEKYDKANFDLETTQCRNFMTARLNYPACVANEKGQPGFSLGQWRIFLGKHAELWASQRETITLYDKNGRIVDQLKY